ncbi:MAG TPA: hypothetical protein PLD59_03855 [Tepidisphaeraceae bacterium]|nr:hypothetical protein [Tepidisphaeraceae bacterium]
MNRPTATQDSNPASIESVPVLPYSVIKGQLDHCDPFWLGRVSAAVIVFLFALICALVADTWRGLSVLGGVNADGWAFHIDYAMSGACMMLFAAGCLLLSSKELDAPENSTLRISIMRALAVIAAAIYWSSDLLSAHLAVSLNLPVENTLFAVMGIATLAAVAIAGTILHQICHRVPHLLLARKVQAVVFLGAGIMIAILLVSMAENMGVAWLTPRQDDPLPKIILLASLAVECFAAVVLAQLLVAINRAAASARTTAIEAIRQHPDS